MGDNIVEAQVQEILARYSSELQRLLEKLQADQAQMQARIRELEEQLANEREAKQQWQRKAERNYRLAEELHHQLYPVTPEEIEAWRNFNPADYPVTIDDIVADVMKLKK